MKKLLLFTFFVSTFVQSQTLEKQFSGELVNSFYNSKINGTKHIGIPDFGAFPVPSPYPINIYNEDYTLYKTVNISQDVYTSSDLDFTDRILVSDALFNSDALIEIGFFTNSGDFYVINENGDEIFSLLNQDLAKELLVYEKFDGQSTYFLNLTSQINGTFIYKLPGANNLGIDPIEQQNVSWSFYPNPVNFNQAAITLDTEDIKGELIFELMDTKGVIVRPKIEKKGDMYQISTNDLEAGVYFLLMINQGKMTSKRIVIR